MGYNEQVGVCLIIAQIFALSLYHKFILMVTDDYLYSDLHRYHVVHCALFDFGSRVFALLESSSVKFDPDLHSI